VNLLGIHYVVTKIVSGGMKNADALKYDLEAWFPAFKEYRQLVFSSNCTDYQSKALRIGYAIKSLAKNETIPFCIF
jgi:seryl-tRNA synthetase